MIVVVDVVASSICLIIIGGWLNIFSLKEVPAPAITVPGLRVITEDKGVGHLFDLLSEVNILFPVAAVERAIVKLKLEGAAVPDMVITLGDSHNILGEGALDQKTFVIVRARCRGEENTFLGEASANKADSLVEVAVSEPEVMGGLPVGTILTVPPSVHDKALRERSNNRVNNTLGEASKEVETSMAFPSKSPDKVGASVVAEGLAPALAPLVLAVAISKTMSLTMDGHIVKGTIEVPVEGHLVLDVAKVPGGVTDGNFLVVPVVGPVAALWDLNLPVVTGQLDAWFVELNPVVDMGSVGGTLSHFEGNNTMNINILITTGRCNPVRGPVALDLVTPKSTIGHKVLSNKMDITIPSTLGTSHFVLSPDVGAILTPPVAGHMVGILLSWVLNSWHVSEAIVEQPVESPGVNFERSTLTDGSLGVCLTILPGGGTVTGNEFAIQCTGPVVCV